MIKVRQSWESSWREINIADFVECELSDSTAGGQVENAAAVANQACAAIGKLIEMLVSADALPLAAIEQITNFSGYIELANDADEVINRG